MENVWTLEDGLRLIRILQPKAKEYGYHIALGGGVLNKGESKKDLDLYFLTLDNGKKTPACDNLVAWLEEMWGNGKDIDNYAKEDKVEDWFEEPPGRNDWWGADNVVPEPRRFDDIRRNEDPFWRNQRLNPPLQNNVEQALNDAFRRADEAAQPGLRNHLDFQGEHPWVEAIDRAIGGKIYKEVSEKLDKIEDVVSKKSDSPYKKKLKFYRGGADGDRIDVFILG